MFTSILPIHASKVYLCITQKCTL